MSSATRCLRSMCQAARASRVPQCQSNTAPRLRSFNSRLGSPSTARALTTSRSLSEKLYTESHEWIEISEDNQTATMGISKHAAQALGDIVFVELPDISLELAPNDVIGAVESVKSASDLYSPVAGTVTEVNSSLEETPSIMNKDAEGEGWIAKLKIKEGEMEKGKEKLMKKEAYDTFIQE